MGISDALRKMISDPQALATLISIGFAVILGAMGFIWNSREQRKRYTFEVIVTHYANNVDLIMSLYSVRKHMANADNHGKAAIDDELERKLLILLTYFQSIAVAMRNDMLDERIVLMDSYANIQRIWIFFQPYIDAQRKAQERPFLYIDLQDFVEKNALKYKDLYAGRGYSVGFPNAATAQAAIEKAA